MRDDLEALIEEARAPRPLHEPHHQRHSRSAASASRASASWASTTSRSPSRTSTAAASDRIAGLRSFERKLEVAGWVKELGFPLTLNIVLHRDNLDRVAEVVALAERLGADRLELANTQYLGWALAESRRAPAHARAARARARRGRRGAAAAARPHGDPVRHARLLHRPPEGLHGRLGAALPRWSAPTASSCPVTPRTRFPGLTLRARCGASARARSGATRPASTPSAARPGCPSRAGAASAAAIDFGGCRCQAFHLTGDAAATDPACRLSPDHGLIEAARAAAAAAGPLAPLPSAAAMISAAHRPDERSARIAP